MMPIPVRLFDRHPPSVLGRRLRHRRRGGEQNPGLGIAPGRGAGRGGLAALLMLPVLGVPLGRVGPFARRCQGFAYARRCQPPRRSPRRRPARAAGRGAPSHGRRRPLPDASRPASNASPTVA